MKPYPLAAKLDTERPLQDNSYAERFECLEEERFARCIVADAEYDVVKHGFSFHDIGKGDSSDASPPHNEQPLRTAHQLARSS